MTREQMEAKAAFEAASKALGDASVKLGQVREDYETKARAYMALWDASVKLGHVREDYETKARAYVAAEAVARKLGAI